MDPADTGISIEKAATAYLQTVKEARSQNTSRTYGNAMATFIRVLREHWIEGDSPVSRLNEDGITWMLSYLRIYKSSTERLYTQAVKGFYQYLASERLAEINLPRLDQFLRQRVRRTGQRFPQFPREEIETILEYVNNITNYLPAKPDERLRTLRDRAFVFTLADTGLRVHEACNLSRGDIDWNESRALVIGKGNKQDIVRISNRTMVILKEYLAVRSSLDGSSGLPLGTLPLFARHDRGAGKKIKPITTATGRNIVNEIVVLALGDEAKGRITPHSFRHYFVTTVLRASGNLKLAQELARHANIQVTQRYAHLSDEELDRGYHEIFEN